MACCQLLHDEWGHCEVDTSGDIHDLRAKGAVRAVMDGYGCVDMCLNHGEFKDAVLMLKVVCRDHSLQSILVNVEPQGPVQEVGGSTFTRID